MELQYPQYEEWNTSVVVPASLQVARNVRRGVQFWLSLCLNLRREAVFRYIRLDVDAQN